MAQSKKVVGAAPFQLEGHTFSVSPSTSAYKLMGSADGVSYGEFGNCSANEVLIVSNSPRGMWFSLSGNNDTLIVTY